MNTDRLEQAIEQTRETLDTLVTLHAEIVGLREEAPQLIGAKEAAELMQIERHEFSRRRRHGRIPPPIAELAAGPVWLRAQFTWPNTLDDGGSNGP